LCAASRKALTAQYGPAGLRLEGHAVALSALITNNLEAFAFTTASTTLSLATKVGAPRIATGLAAFRVS